MVRILKFLMIILLLWLVLGQVGGVLVILFQIFGKVCELVIKFGFAAGAVWIVLRVLKSKDTDTKEDDDSN
jgi:ethanolamine transporter EutH